MTRELTRILLPSLAAAAVLVTAPSQARAQIYLGPEVAWNDDFDFGVGAGLEFDLPEIDPAVSFMGDFLLFFPDRGDYFEFNTNAVWEFVVDAPVEPFALAGLNVGRYSFDNEGVGEGDGGSETEVGLNVGGGIRFDAGSVQPRVVARFSLFGFDDNFSVTFFVPFRVGS